MQDRDTFDAIVIGGGLYGASLAYWLTARGLSVALVERHHLGSGPTARSSANMRLHYTTVELAELARIGHEVLETFEERTGTNPAFHRIGVLYALGVDLAPAFAESVSRLRERGFDLELLTTGEVGERFPSFDMTGVVAGLWEPQSGYADPVGVTTGFANAAAKQGAVVRTNAPVLGVLVDSGHITGVELASGERISASRVVLATGPWSKDLAASAGVNLPIVPERRAVTVVNADRLSSEVVPCVWVDKVKGFYARPEGPGSLILGGRTSKTSPVDDPDRYDESVSLEESGEHVARASSRIPAIASLGIRGGYASLYDMSPDGLPLVGKTMVAGLYICAGMSGTGFKLAAGIGQELARLVVDGRADLLEPLALDRAFGATRELST